MSQSYIRQTKTVPQPWQDPIFTVSAASSMLAADNVFLLMYVDDNEESSGHIMVRFDGEDMEILTLWVQPNNRRKGVGRALLTALLAEALKQKVKKIFLEVRPSNTPAVKLYQAAGFTKIAARLKYYQAPVEDAAVYEKVLS